ncbi:hypothetical protein MNBD_NITROSPINAE02-409 [hydrothermal vent metagenome]|uniref:Tetrapyrrole methylase domain-containing protein n=1 Tax=hydrothermal vent metagenome TaxID=652676 RepID=A0A3B1CPE7_9ZZZZ
MEQELNKIVIVGMGPGSEEYITPAALKAIDGADVVAGSKNLFNLIPDNGAQKIFVGADIEKALGLIEEKLGKGKIAVLVSGDPGIYSFAKLVIKKFGVQACRVIPGVSSVQTAFARVGLDWLDAKIISVHAANPKVDIVETARVGKIALLAGRKESLEWIWSFAKGLKDNRRIFMCENLCLGNEKVYETDLSGLPGLTIPSRTIVLLIRRDILE